MKRVSPSLKEREEESEGGRREKKKKTSGKGDVTSRRLSGSGVVIW